MKLQRLLVALLVLTLLTVAMGNTSAPVTAHEETPAATQADFDIKVALQSFYSTLPEGFYGIKPEDALKAMSGSPKPFLIDLREEKEFADGGYIAGAVSIPIRKLTQSLEMLPIQTQPIIVYCSAGHRGGLALQTLHMLGYTNVKSILGGLNNWKAAKLPLATGEPTTPNKMSEKPVVDSELFAVLDKFISGLPDGFLAAPATDVLKSLQSDMKPVLIDVRGPAELTATGYIDGSENIIFPKIMENLDKLPKDLDTPIITYCAIGHRGAMAMMTLRLLGYTNVKSLGGGFNNWVKNGLPIITPVPTQAATTKP